MDHLIATTHAKALHLTPKAGAFFASAISEKNIAFARSSLASGDSDLGRSTRQIIFLGNK